ncbi:isopenicillin N synthase family dioxygenase [Actinomadura keratinilytica]|uniref:2-oxoglutarate and iron-dependent oxygenase domain-containing protein n=1 Tax=Actinomadura keratinilytica TaxID=547461 RepID=A0ABP7YT39_9ACTN
MPPTIDLADHLSGSASRRRDAAHRAAQSCTEFGLFLLRGHGLDPDLLRDVHAVAREFFDAPEDYKRRFHLPGSSRGYTPLGTESLASTGGETAPADVKEAFAIGTADVPERSAEYAGAGLRTVEWPDRPARFRETLLDYYRAAHALAGRVMGLLADALGVPEAAFADKMDRSADFLRLIGYPEQDRPPEAGAMRAGAHTDFGVLAMIAADDAPGGLQVQTRDGRWLDVPAPPGTLVVNIGDLMAYWTGRRWRSAVHRVVNPPAGAAGATRRQSIVFFHNPNLDAVIEPLRLRDAPGEPRPRPVVAGEWLTYKSRRQRTPAAPGPQG